MEEKQIRQIGRILYLNGLLFGLSVGLVFGSWLPAGVILPTFIMLTILAIGNLVYQLHQAHTIQKQLKKDSDDTIMPDSAVDEDPLLEWQNRFDASNPVAVEHTASQEYEQRIDEPSHERV